MVIIGAGLAGLACARTLAGLGIPTVVLDASDGVGGRVRTDRHEGFLLDRGFQVLQTAYPEARQTLDYAALDLCPFRPGALIRHAGGWHRIGDPWRHPGDLLPTLRAPIGPLGDKLRMARLRREVRRGDLAALYARPETTAAEALRARGFSPAMLEGFLRPFLAGVFFDPELAFSSRAMAFVLRAFASGDTALPAQGIGAIPQQLAAALPDGTVRLNARVERLEEGAVVLADGERIAAIAVVVAADPWEAARLLGDPSPPAARATTCLYFAAPEPPPVSVGGRPLLVLNGEGRGPINSLVVPSELSAAYAPEGQALVTVNVLGDPHGSDADLERAVRAQLQDWYGAATAAWRLLRVYRIRHALPVQAPPVPDPQEHRVIRAPRLFVCGEHAAAPSIQWALASGRRAGELVAAFLR